MRHTTPHAPTPPSELKEALTIIGGRLSYLTKVTRAKDVKEAAELLLEVEKQWLLSQIGLIPDCDDDVMDEVGGIVGEVLLCGRVDNGSETAKMELMLVALVAGVCQDSAGAGTGAGAVGSTDRRSPITVYTLRPSPSFFFRIPQPIGLIDSVEVSPNHDAA
jgi:hypothetical protein